MMNIEEQIITLPATELAPSTELYIKTYVSKDRDTIILLPGGPGNDHSLYDTPVHSIAKMLSSFLNVVLFDPRGCGKSQKSDVKYCSLTHYIKDVELLRDHLQIPAHRFLVFGQSYGAIAALGYALSYPDCLKKLLLIGGAVSGDFIKEAKNIIAERGSFEQQEMAEKIWSGCFQSPSELSEFYRIMGPLYSSTFDPYQPVPPIASNIDILNFGWGQFLKKFDFRSCLAKITCETLILWGEDEVIFSKNQMDFLTKHIKRCQLIPFLNCGHLLWVDNWPDFEKFATAFCQSGLEHTQKLMDV